MSKSQIKFSKLNENQTIQIIDLDDYFGDGIPKITKPLTKLKFIKEHLQEILDDEESGVEDVNEAFEMMDSHGDGDSNKVFVTIEDGVVKLVIA
jgi:hypothetical protein